ncbi:YlqD family protein [Jeotgalibacillus sp. ET6]|uniref:YlqD family protein n=1 Tax=Jeotgalibacillus sp. ET6 TaxID=3037260 RepID=UPI00241818A2|nr:YlqD family protein [Jeotgalibacillus sp. ET6]MDG5470265.1 YlqD family protein [Jeotgalibacillus sp. ET6]
MQVTQKTIIKEIMTNSSKSRLKQTLNEKIKRAEKEMDQLVFQQKKLEKQFEQSSEAVKQKIQQEINKRKQLVRSINTQLKSIEETPLGTEYTLMETDTVVELHEGSIWHPEQKPVIVLEDGMVKEIRQRW